MNETITIDGKEYEVLPLGRIGEITHARLAGGKVVEATCIDRLYIRVGVPLTPNDCHVYYSDEFEDNGIQPLKLIERKPVEFVATFAKIGHEWHPVYNLDEGLAQQGREQKEFRCTEVIK